MSLLDLIPGKKRGIRLLALAGACAVLLVAGCAQLAQKERELVFRIEPGEARWYGGLPQGVQELNIPVQSKAIKNLLTLATYAFHFAR